MSLACPRLLRVILVSLAATVAAAACTTVRPAPPTATAPAVQRQPTVESWEISPAEGYQDGYGYVRLEFLPPGAPGLPAGGRLVVHLGRQRLEHANTIWYSFRVTEGIVELLSMDGPEGIPNIKGPDGNWWTDVDLDLPGAFSRPLLVTVNDARAGMTYTFTVQGK
jgi:hypothetical protein